MSFAVTTEVLVRFRDVDGMGHVNNACYLTYFEQARVEYFKRLGDLDLRSMNGTSERGFIVAEINVKYLSPAFLEEVLVVGVKIAEVRNKSFRMEYEIWEKNTKRPLASGYSAQVLYNYKAKKTFEVPEDLKKKIELLEKS